MLRKVRFGFLEISGVFTHVGWYPMTLGVVQGMKMMEGGIPCVVSKSFVGIGIRCEFRDSSLYLP